MRTNIQTTTWILRSLLLVVAAMWAVTNSYAQDGVLKDDAYTQSSTPNQNFGANANLRVASGINSYLRFDLSTLPPGTVGSDVGKATLRLYVNTLTTAGAFDVYRVTGAWDEGTITGNSVPSLGGADVTAAGVPAGSVDSFVTVDITALVKDWLNGVIANNGIALLPNAAGISVRFDSKENGSTSHEPRLEITLKGLADLAHDGSLIGEGTSGNPLGVANQGVGNAQLANGAVSSAKIAAGQVVKSLNLLKDDVNLAPGSNVTITPSGNTLTIAAAGGLAGVSHNTTLIGDGTSSLPLSVAVPLTLTGSDPGFALSVSNTGSGAAITATGAINTSTHYSIAGNRVVSTSGSNTFVGVRAGASNTTSLGNSFFGLDAGVLNSTGSSNSFFGASSGSSNTSGILNSFFGGGAGLSNTTASRNSFFGARAGSSNVTGFGNSFFGSDVGRSNTTAFRNSFFGDQSGRNNVSGSDNSFFGSGTGSLNTTGAHNSFFGSSAGFSNTTGGSNAFFGDEAGAVNTTGIGNAFFGASAGRVNTTGLNNAFFGTQAGFSNTVGIFNVFFGTVAGNFNTAGNNNVFIGHNAGNSNTNENNNTFVGFSSNGAPGITNATAIGADAVVEQSNSVVLGHNANVGIGTSAPSSKLTVAGIIESTGGGVKFPDGTTQTTAATGGGGAITGVTAGTALTGGGMTGNVTIAVATGGVNTAQIADSAITVTKLGFDPATQGELDAHKSSGDHDSRYALIAHTHNVSEVNNAATLGGNTFLGDQTIKGANVTVGNSSIGGSITVTNTVNRFVDIGSNIGFDSVAGTSVGIRLKATQPIEADSYGLFLGSNVFPGAFVIRKDDLTLPSSERNRFVIAGNGDVIISPGNVGIGTTSPQARLHVIGDFVATGTKSAVVALPDKRVVSLYAVESPENWFEDFGSAKLTGGVAQVALDSTFSQTVNTDMTYHVFLTPNGNSQGLYVARKTSGGFEVREQGDGKSDVAFDYRIVARRRGYEELRLREVPSDSPAKTATNRRIP